MQLQRYYIDEVAVSTATCWLPCALRVRAACTKATAACTTGAPPPHSVYMAALCATRCNPSLATHYERLRDRSKQPSVALVAVTLQLVALGNALLHAHGGGSRVSHRNGGRSSRSPSTFIMDVPTSALATPCKSIWSRWTASSSPPETRLA